jgi:hypothetical protein
MLGVGWQMCNPAAWQKLHQLEYKPPRKQQSLATAPVLFFTRATPLL